jgi:NitT/TauT family transport system substrate-binding protein
MEKANSEKGSSNDPPLSPIARFFFRAQEDFALERSGFVIILIVSLVVGLRVYKHGKDDFLGLLKRPLRVGIVSWPGYVGGLVANNGLHPNKDSFFWKRNLLVDFKVINSEADLLDQLKRSGDNGGIDVMWSTVDSLAHQFPKLLEKDVEARAFMQVDWSRGGDAIVAGEDIQKIEDLKGKKIALSMSASEWLLEHCLANSSLANGVFQKIPVDRHYTDGGSREALKEFLDGQVDAAVLWEPNVIQAKEQKKGTHVLVDSKTARNLIADVMVAKDEFMLQRPGSEAIKAFIEGWFEGTQKAKDDPMLAVNKLQELEEEAGDEKLTDEQAREMLDKVAWSSIEENIQMFGLAGGRVIFDDIFNAASRLWRKQRDQAKSATDQEKPANAETARKTELLEEVCKKAVGSFVRTGRCGLEIMTSPLAVAFAPHSKELSEEAKRVLDEDDVSLLFQAYSESSFCVQASAGQENNRQRALDIRRARENAVIAYLLKNYDLRRSQFISSDELADSETISEYVRLKVLKDKSNRQ